MDYFDFSELPADQTPRSSGLLPPSLMMNREPPAGLPNGYNRRPDGSQHVRTGNGWQPDNGRNRTRPASRGPRSSHAGQSRQNFSSAQAETNSTGRGSGNWRGVQQSAGAGRARNTFSNDAAPSRPGASREHDSNGEGRGGQQQPGRGYQNFPLNFTTLKKLAEETIEISEIVQKLTKEDFGLKRLLKENASNNDIIELVLVVIGGFCSRNGAASFNNAFLKMMQILLDEGIFQKVVPIIFQLPNSHAANLGRNEDRLKRLVQSVNHIAIEMLILMPALACNCLGENFFADLMSLKDTPSIRALNSSNVFDELQETSTRLKNAWEQNSKATPKPSTGGRNAFRALHNEFLSALQPPEDFRQLNIIPNEEDMRTDSEPFLRPNIIKGSYPDVDTYLDVQFRLLREDFFMPLRDGLNQYKIKAKSGPKQRYIRVDNVRLYKDVQILDLDKDSDDTYTLQFASKGMERINWEGSKRLLFGSLLLLSADDFNTFYLFTVTDRNPAQLVRGKFKAKFEGTTLPVHIRKQRLMMAESSVFFEAYRSILHTLQRISPTHFPMKEYILGQSVQPEVPGYLTNKKEPFYDLTPVRESFQSPENSSDDEESRENTHMRPRIFLSSPLQRQLSNVPILDRYDCPGPDTLGLDPSQTEALYTALTHKLAVIQGPPGTGKTFLGLKVVQVLLKNKKYWIGTSAKPEQAPILVICFTNHALDQFLEGISKFTNSIVRIGGQSKSEAMQKFGLKEWRIRAATMRTRPAKLMHWQREARAKLDDQKRVLDEFRGLAKAADMFGIVHEDTLLELDIISKDLHLKLLALRALANRTDTFVGMSVLTYWLGLDSDQILNGVLAALEKSETKANQAAAAAAPDPVDEPLSDDDQWDREDVEEIQDQRMVADDVDLDNITQKRKQEQTPKSTASVKLSSRLRFTLTVYDLEEKCRLMREDCKQLEGKDLQWMELKIAETQNRIQTIGKLLRVISPTDDGELQALIKQKPLSEMNYLERWRIYSAWKSQVVEIMEANVAEIEKEYRIQASELEDLKITETAEIIRSADVIGITTTGAAKQKPLLEHLKCKIVVVEEAAEVLEAHIITALSSSCQHLILIGDHQQLRPSPTVYELAVKYHLDVSLFERLIKNGMAACVLGVQHRMRPEVARLIVPAIYPKLENHESVLRYPNVSGMVHNVFFLTHSELEKGDKSDQESRSRTNPYEADLALALARHLLLQGLEPSQITILTTYSGQLLYFRKIRRVHAVLKDVRISVVDNFQGEENDIIILSLVRSNEDADIGFLKTENRICVALSRAKIGFYLIGNMDNLEHCKRWRGQSDVWGKISKVLQTNGQLGTHFKLQCGNHPYIITPVNQVTEFPPEGGCFTKCEKEMPCKHICRRFCHIEDPGHQKQKCDERCTRSCSKGHSCPKKCYQDCHPCLSMMEKVLPCTHSQLMLCFKDPAEEYCVTKVVKDFPTCTHRIELDCGRPISKETCPEKCGMQLDCHHICNLNCHKRSSHDKLPCRQPCLRTPCPEKHSCPKQCFEDCGKCLVDVVKKLPCGHQATIKCSTLPQDAYCSVKVERILDDCEHTGYFDCSGSTKGYQCRQPCQRLLCKDGHPCRKLCWQPCGPCHVRVDRQLSCGHVSKGVECCVDPKKIKCKVPKDVTLPQCGHRVQIPCGEDPEMAICPKPCDIRLECGHQCVLTCHVKNDPNHENYICTKICARKKVNCKSDHKCGKKCHELCDPCQINVNRTLPCGHEVFTQCGLDDEQIICREKVKKTIPDCGHEIQVDCTVKPTREMCQQPCTRRLMCGDLCKKECRMPCFSEDCEEPLKTSSVSYCGHPVFKKCAGLRRNPVGPVSEEEKIKFLQLCPQPCRSILPCEHPCKGECGACSNGRVHKACEEECGRPLVCGHICNVNCATSCPPCKEICEYRCQHSKCNKKCCEPCQNCVEPCGWRCKHHKCTRKCWEPCNRPPCDEPCQERLPCGHSCIGLCGEQCPPLCRICNKEELTDFILYGNEEDEDARFVYLSDCGHSIEVDGLDHWMQMAQDPEASKEIQMKCCPRCKTIIRSCYRYGDIIKRNFADIVLVKKRLLSSRENPKDFMDKLNKKVTQLRKSNEDLIHALNHDISPVIAGALAGIERKLSPRKVGKREILPSFDDDERFLMQVQLDLMERLLEIIKNAPTVAPSPNQPGILQPSKMKPLLLFDFLNQTERLLRLLLGRQRMSTEEYQSFIAEIDRLDLIRAYFLLQSAPNYQPGHSSISVECSQLENTLIRNVKKLTDREKASVKNVLEQMGKKLNTGLGISDAERQQIIKAMGLTQGHWFKCPNGHIYAIGECGGAMQEARCGECNARIGGGSHRLRADNQLAREMDGARFAAWSEHANDMANFRLDD